MNIIDFEKSIFESGLTHLFKDKKVDDFLLTGKANAERESYRCCNEKVAERMIDLAELKDGDEIMEGSAGKGMILKKLVGYKNHYYCELNAGFVENFLKPISEKFLFHNFLHFNAHHFDKIIINPPFAFNQYAEHILHAYSILKQGGILVSLFPVNGLLLKIQNEKFLELVDKGEVIDVGNVCGEDTRCSILKVVKP